MVDPSSRRIEKSQHCFIVLNHHHHQAIVAVAHKVNIAFFFHSHHPYSVQEKLHTHCVCHTHATDFNTTLKKKKTKNKRNAVVLSNKNEH